MVKLYINNIHLIAVLREEFLVFSKETNENNWEFQRIITCCSDSPKSSDKAIECCSFSPCAKYFGVSYDKNIVIYETVQWTILCASSGQRKGSCLQFFSTSKTLILANKSGCVMFYSFQENNLVKLDRSLGHNSMLTNALITTDEKFIITSDRDEKIRITNYPNVYNIERFCLGHTQFVTWIAFLPTHKEILVSCSGDGTVRFWDYMSGKELAVYSCHTSNSDQNNSIDKKIVLTKIVGCEINFTSILAVLQYNCNQIKILKVTVDCDKSLGVNEIGIINLECVPWDICFCEKHLMCILPNRNHPFRLWSLTENNFVQNMRFQSIEKYFTINFDKILNATLKTSDDISVLFKKEFDNISEYEQRKRARLLKTGKTS